MIQEESTRRRAAAPRTIGGVLDDAIGLYRRSFSRLWPLTLVAAVFIALPGIFFGAQMTHARALAPQAALAMMRSPGYWLSYVLMSLIYLVVQGALLSALDRFATRGELSVGDALSVGARRLPSMIAVGVLSFLSIMVGFILLIVPGIYIWGIFQLALVALIVDGVGITESFGVSRRLIKGHWWRSVTIVTVGIIIVFVFTLLAGVVNGVVVALTRFDPAVVLVVEPAVGAIVNVFMLPLLPSISLCMYYDLKLRSEGQDLAARVGALAVQ